MIKLGIVICNYNKREKCLKSIEAVLSSKYTDYHIFVVDNGSTDGSAAAINAEYGDCRKLTLIRNAENLGASGGFNKGLRTAFVKNDFKYFMCLGNDVIVDENCLEKLVNYMDENTSTGIVGPKICRSDNPSVIWECGNFIDYDKFSMSSPYTGTSDNEDFCEAVVCDAVPICALMIRRTVMEIIGFLPEDYFLFMDDAEWCYRTKKAGFKVIALGSAKAVFDLRLTEEASSTFSLYYEWRNRIRFFSEHVPENRIFELAEHFLGLAFHYVYEGYYRGESKLSETVIAAIDDALHGKKGQAGVDRIFETENSYDGLKEVISGLGVMAKVQVIDRGFTDYALLLKDLILEKKDDVVFTEINPDITFEIVEDIFSVRDTSLKKIYADVRGNVIGRDKDVLKVANYKLSQRAFMAAWRPLALRLIREMERK